MQYEQTQTLAQKCATEIVKKKKEEEKSCYFLFVKNRRWAGPNLQCSLSAAG